MKWTFKFTPKFFSSKCSCRNYESNFENPAEKSLTEGRFFSVHWPKKMKKISFFEFFFLKKPLQTGSIQFWQTCRKEKDRSPKNNQCRKPMNEKMSFSQTFVLKMFLWTGILQYWQHHWESIDKKPTCRCSMSKDVWKNFKKTSFWSNFPNGHVEARFHNPAGKTPTGGFL